MATVESREINDDFIPPINGWEALLSNAGLLVISGTFPDIFTSPPDPIAVKFPPATT
ncbi:hypothetical protein [Geminicoccus harenae]|uniref:hypothetical protein n=1 Tax=Geminicoccus harenae TaxID=2498453 RepID=UPI001C93A1C7|nr:hypothetical protein [Geminicoccus harenae]